MFFDYLTKCTGKNIDIYVVQQYIQQHKEYENELKALATKSMKLGITNKTVNKVLKMNVVPQFECQLAKSYKDHKEKVKNEKFILTTKLNGCKMIAFVKDGKVDLKTRLGKHLAGDFVEIKNDLSKLPNGVYDGECLAIGDFKTNVEQYQATKKLFTKKGIVRGLKFVCYDYVENIDDFKNGISYVSTLERKNKLEEILSENYTFVKYLKPIYIGSDINNIEKQLCIAIDNFEEGIMVSIAKAPYECKRTTNLLKVKLFNEADIYVYDIYEGTGKLQGTLGGVNCKFIYKDKVCYVNIGSGFSDSERDLYWNNKELIMNKVITVNYKDIITDKNNNITLYLPTWKHIIRTDKESINDTNV